MLGLGFKRSCHTIYLFDHCFHQYLNLNTDLDRGNDTTANGEAIVLHGVGTRYDLAEAAIAAPGLDPATEILRAQHGGSRIDAIRIFLRPPKSVEVFIKMHRHEISKIGFPMEIHLPFE